MQRILTNILNFGRIVIRLFTTWTDFLRFHLHPVFSDLPINIQNLKNLLFKKNDIGFGCSIFIQSVENPRSNEISIHFSIKNIFSKKLAEMDARNHMVF